jgi:hypothetical protein
MILSLVLQLEPAIARCSYPAHLHSLSDLVLELLLVVLVVIIVTGLFHLAARTYDVLFLVVFVAVIIHLIVNILPVVVVVESIVYILLLNDVVLVLIDPLHKE